ncbi:methyltransferase [uncultured Aquimarina sp.]|jgi:protein-S-isoprenylcysteine O-methyltransferase Ste14|uniref:methyltransferase family protein n=1 Tax=uncultured Aquimarina sp. TaxID=575652 RepID=UPI002636ACD4|nr:methyltransferase [uncultured Aquimarina sp.]
MQNDKKGVTYVLIQFILFVLYVLPIYELRIFCFSSIRYLSLIVTILGGIIIFGSIFRLRNQLSPFPAPLQDGILIQNGFFRFSRHPIYSGILISCFFYALYSCSGFKIIISIGLLILFYFKSSYEEKLLSRKYVEYNEYKKRVGRFFPKVF